MYRVIAYGLLALLLALIFWKYEDINAMMGGAPSSAEPPAGQPAATQPAQEAAPPPSVDFKM